MTISTKGRYAIRALMEIAMTQDKELALVKDVAVAQGISEKYLERIFSTLKNGGFIKSRRGCKGGYTLARNPDQISVLDVLKTMEGSLAPVECVETTSACRRSESCAVRGLWLKLNNSIEATLRDVTIAQLAEEQLRCAARKQPMMFHI